MTAHLLIAVAFMWTLPPGQAGSGNGRVVATFTGLEGTVQLSGVDVDLRSPDSGITIAQTMTDGRGQVTFPDIPAGRYVVTARRPGFFDTDSTPFEVRDRKSVV